MGFLLLVRNEDSILGPRRKPGLMYINTPKANDYKIVVVATKTLKKRTRSVNAMSLARETPASALYRTYAPPTFIPQEIS